MPYSSKVGSPALLARVQSTTLVKAYFEGALLVKYADQWGQARKGKQEKKKSDIFDNVIVVFSIYSLRLDDCDERPTPTQLWS